ncbi:MAG: low temperature requirement protein A [Actinomycetota bacterium]
MKDLDIPDPADDFTADPVELFFDLAFVFAFSQLVAHLIHHPTWEGAGDGLLLFLMLWLPWTQFTWSANAVPGNRREVRLVILVATAASVPMAAGVTTAFGDGGPVFAIPLALITVLGLALLGMASETGSELHRAISSYAVPNAVTGALFIVGSFVDDGAVRRSIWILGLVVVVIGTVRAGSASWVLRPGHFAERHGLIIIVALGEVIVAIARPVVEGLEEGAGLPSESVLSLVAAGAFAALLFWAYFDRPQHAFEHGSATREGRERTEYARDVYTYFHAAIVAGIILAAAAVEEAALHPAEALPLEYRTMLFGGLVLFLLGVLGGVARAYRVIPPERLVAIPVLAAVIYLGADLDGMVLLLLVDAVLLAVLATEYRRIEVPAAGGTPGTRVPTRE